MKNVLCIAYLFPPRAGVGVQRITKFVKYLPEMGWRPIVLTPEKPPDSFPLDSSYEEEIPDSVIIEKAPSFEPYHIYRMLGGKKRQDSADFRGVLEGGKKLGIGGRLYSNFQAAFLIPDPKIGWFYPALKKARQICREHKIDAIFSTSPEATDHVIARALAREVKIPWVMDFRDPWTTSLYAIKRPVWAKYKEEALELSCLRETSAITVVQQRYRDEYIQKYPELERMSGKFRILPNGFDPLDYENLTPRHFDKWTVVYTGSISYPRDPKPFFEGWKKACDKSDEFRDNAGCLFMGEFDTRFHENAPRYIMSGLVIEGFKNRNSVIEAQLGAGALLLISEGYITGKAYEYLGSMRPILAITESIDLSSLLLESRSGLIVKPSDSDKIADALISLYESRDAAFEPDRNFLNGYNRKKITADLAELMNDIAEKHNTKSG